MRQRGKKTQGYREIIDRIAGLISRGELRQGERLPAERRLAERFGVSRGALRQALQVLAEHGFIERRQGDGTYLRAEFTADPTRAGLAQSLDGQLVRLHEILEFRRLIEPRIAALAARRIDSDTVDRLKILVCDQQRVLLSGQEGEEDLDAAFHHLLAEGTGNRVLVQVMATIRSILDQSRSRQLQSPEREQASVEGHLRILDAVIRREPEEAAQAMQQHLQEIEAAIFSAPVGRNGESGKDRPEEQALSHQHTAQP
ncbi:MAG: FadR/GntR family transcriptional regulator [Desulfobulbus sp.]|jgi:GntR family transcriptional repressor for pyruvate dehydrogenase complex